MDNYVDFTIINIGTLSMNKYWGESQRVRETTATCTLLRTTDFNLLVDPSPYPTELANFLYANIGMTPDKIDFVFLTHFHGDHRYGLGLFPDAVWFMPQAGLDEWLDANPSDRELIDSFHPAEKQLAPGVDVLPAPGHTYGLHALSVMTRWGSLVVAGDAVMTPEFFNADEGFHNSVDFDMASATIKDIKQMADLVIPGHGNVILNNRG